MNILVVGGGAREHTICWKLKQSKKVSKIYCAPGNAGISEIAQCVNIEAEDIKGITEFAVQEKIDMVVVGPEGPLVAGLVDVLKDNGIKTFGPNQNGAKLEGSKSYSKDFMKKYNIPTAKYETFVKPQDALEGLKNFNVPIVVKADGLAAGKGVLICQSSKRSRGCNKQYNE